MAKAAKKKAAPKKGAEHYVDLSFDELIAMSVGKKAPKKKEAKKKG